jgi:hypothetical protein
VSARPLLLPDVPACWSWDLPPLPQPSDASVLRKWQAGRCAICGEHEPPPYGLVEDHDHSTGNVRGYLCERDNLMEGRRNPRPVFLLYRQRHPANMIGILDRYRCGSHPEVAAAAKAWTDALGDLHRLSDEGRAWHERELADLRSRGITCDLGWLSRIPERTPLMDAAERVGITAREWNATLRERHAIARAETVHLPDAGSPPRNACKPEWGWSRPYRPLGGRVVACIDCLSLDRERLTAMVAAFSPCEEELAFARDPANVGAGGVL